MGFVCKWTDIQFYLHDLHTSPSQSEWTCQRVVATQKQGFRSVVPALRRLPLRPAYYIIYRVTSRSPRNPLHCLRCYVYYFTVQAWLDIFKNGANWRRMRITLEDSWRGWGKLKRTEVIQVLRACPTNETHDARWEAVHLARTCSLNWIHIVKYGRSQKVTVWFRSYKYFRIPKVPFIIHY